MALAAWRPELALVVLLVVGSVCTGCSTRDTAPTQGNYTVVFPSTEAAVVTDFVQLLIFDVPDPATRGRLCADLMAARIADPSTLRPSVSPPPANICQMRAGRSPVTVPYGEHALLAIAQKREDAGAPADFLIGCEIMTVGKGDAPAPIPLHLVRPADSLPTSNCRSVSEYCDDKCP